ncbi:hypothetical protein EJ07DRAFT_154062 [Lizonia empirigonia]|nr:hypothetical protein EJ07DRAFT_154062 [Lizonia empirigonia]
MADCSDSVGTLGVQRPASSIQRSALSIHHQGWPSASLQAQEGQLQPSHVRVLRALGADLAPRQAVFGWWQRGGSDSNPSLHQGATTKPLALPVRALPTPPVDNLALEVQVVLCSAPIPLPPARHCFLASAALLALCDPESRILAFHACTCSQACLCPRPLVLAAACIEFAFEEGPSR